MREANAPAVSLSISFLPDRDRLVREAAEIQAGPFDEMQFAALGIFGFLCPTWIRVDGVNVLSPTDEPTSYAVAALAMDLERDIDRALQDGHSETVLWGVSSTIEHTLIFQFDGTALTLTSKGRRQTFALDANDAKAVVRSFARDVAVMIRDAFPEYLEVEPNREWYHRLMAFDP